jgi:hypothetical protein
MSKELGQIAYEAMLDDMAADEVGCVPWCLASRKVKARWAATESAVRADATRELVKALEHYACNCDEGQCEMNDHDSVVCGFKARAALEKARGKG